MGAPCHSSKKTSRNAVETSNFSEIQEIQILSFCWEGYVEAMPRGTSINAVAYCNTLRRLHEAINLDIRREALPSARQCTHIAHILQSLHWELLNRRLCGFNLGPSDYYLFGPLKQHSNEGVEMFVLVSHSCQDGTNASTCSRLC